MKKYSSVIIILFLLYLSGCATLPTDEEIDKDIYGFELPKLPSEGKGIVYIIRPSKLGFIIKFDVYINEKKVEYLVGSTTGGQYIYFDIDSGSHTILSQAENLAQYTIETTAGGIYFLEQVPGMGILFARNDLQVVKDNAGKYWVKRLEAGTMTNP